MSLRAARSPGTATAVRRDARALERDAVAQRVVGRRQVALDVVRERVHAGGRGHRRRQPQRQLGIGEHRLRQQPGREEDALDVRVVLRDHAGAPDLGAGARGRGQGDEVGQWIDDRPHLRVVPGVLEDVALVHPHHADHLGHVQRGAAAEADHAVRAVLPERLRAGHCLARRRVAGHAVEDRRIEAAEVAAELGQHGQRGQRAVGDDQGPLAPRLAQVLRDQAARARAEVDGGGKGESMEVHGWRTCTQRSSSVSLGH
jgi:hypothetical protein